jgi:hypothetical protein
MTLLCVTFGPDKLLDLANYRCSCGNKESISRPRLQKLEPSQGVHAASAQVSKADLTGRLGMLAKKDLSASTSVR